jgi:transcription termination factor Rho
VVEPQAIAGVLELEGKSGSGYLRLIKNDISARDTDIFVPQSFVREHQLRTGDFIDGMEGTPPKGGGGRGSQGGSRRSLLEITTINGLAPDAELIRCRRDFKVLTSIDPDQKFQLSRATKDPSVRLVDLLTPVGMGQRGLIVAPPRTGKTMLLQGLANQISQNHPDVHLIVVLVDERPEEATDWKRKVEHGEVISSTSDEPASNHVKIAELSVERAKRLVEVGLDVVILFDSLTRLARAYNLETKNSGRTLSGGVDARTLAKPKAFFGAARKAEEGGSLTILATALIETGSRMDEVIFEEFKGTGNMELVLSRKLADMRIFPAIDLHLSGTRKEEKLIPDDQLPSVWALRRVLQKIDPVEGIRILVNKLDETNSNEEFLKSFQQT